MRRKIYLIIVLIAITHLSGFAQKVKIEHALEQLGEGYNSAFRISIPHASMKTVEKKWNSFIKNNNGKVKSSKGVIKGENAIINGIGHDTIQIYSRLVEDADGVLLKAAFKNGGIFISPESESTYNHRLEQLLTDFALELSKEGLNIKLEVAAALVKDSQKQQTNLEKTNERLTADNESMKKQIATNEETIEENKGKIEELKLKVKGQQQSLELLRGKFSELK